ncbi:unnamed protein product [Lota lota]
MNENLKSRTVRKETREGDKGRRHRHGLRPPSEDQKGTEEEMALEWWGGQWPVVSGQWSVERADQKKEIHRENEQITLDSVFPGNAARSTSCFGLLRVCALRGARKEARRNARK